MVPILNHSLFININNKIIKLIIEMVIAIGLDITIWLVLNLIDSNKTTRLSVENLKGTAPYLGLTSSLLNKGFILYSEEKKNISLIILK